MNEVNTEKPRFSLRSSDKIILGILAGLIVLIIALNVLVRFGLTLVNGALMLFLPTFSLFILVGWIGYVLIRRIKNKTARLVVGSLLGMLLFVLLMLVFTYVSFIANVSVPRKYATLKSPSGEHTLVVLRALDPDEERIEQRRAARLAANPDSDPEVTAADWGYLYKAYPNGPLGLFYRSNADVEGEVYLTVRDIVTTEDTQANTTSAPTPDASAEPASGESTEAAAEPESEAATEESAEPESEAATEETAEAVSEAATDEAAEPAESEPIGVMMLEWLDDENTAHFYVENAGVAEGGDCYVRFQKQ